MNFIQIELNQNKKRKLNHNIDIDIENNIEIDTDIDIFILNRDNLENYKYVDPNELLIIDTSYDYSNIFYKTIIEGGIKSNVKKIITSDLVIRKYFFYIEQEFELYFPYCDTIHIYTLSNDFILISGIIDDLKIIKNIEYILDNNVFFNNSVIKYNNFTKSFFIGSLSNISFVKIINKITKETDCTVERKIIENIIDFNEIDNKNKSQLYNIKKYNIDNMYINNILLEYIDKKMNIHVKKNIYNITDIDFTI